MKKKPSKILKDGKNYINAGVFLLLTLHRAKSEFAFAFLAQFS